VSTPAASSLSSRDIGAALAVVVIWGLNFVAMKVALRDFTPFQLGAARYLLAVLPLVFFLRRPPIAWKWLLLYGLFQGVGQFGFLFWALKVGMTGSLASVLMQTQVFFTALLGFALMGEKPGPSLRLGLWLAALGLGCFAMNFASTNHTELAVVTIFGLVLNLCAAFMWASSNIVVRQLQRTGASYDAVGFVVWSSLVPVLPFVAASWLLDAPTEHGRWMQAGPVAWLAVAFLGWVATVVAYALWTGLLKRHPANRVAPFSLGVPVVGLAAGMLVLGETVAPWQWAGIALLAGALACVMLGDRLLNKPYTKTRDH
jgi:O-acetylserine/cysteine efflux transporter